MTAVVFVIPSVAEGSPILTVSCSLLVVNYLYDWRNEYGWTRIPTTFG